MQVAVLACYLLQLLLGFCQMDGVVLAKVVFDGQCVGQALGLLVVQPDGLAVEAVYQCEEVWMEAVLFALPIDGIELVLNLVRIVLGTTDCRQTNGLQE